MPPTIPSSQQQNSYNVGTKGATEQKNMEVDGTTKSPTSGIDQQIDNKPIKVELMDDTGSEPSDLRPAPSITPPYQKPQLSHAKCEEFEFEVPEEAPVFVPTAEEFKNPLQYIAKIRSVAEKFGICKIKPPADWQPPFTVDVDNLRFTPRVQRLNELEAKTRIKLNFLDQIAKFWELQGNSLKIPMVERKVLDLYSLHRIVQEEGGLDITTKERKWSKVANRMGYLPGKNVGTILKGHYERILFPYDIYISGKAIDGSMNLEVGEESDDCDYKPHCILSRQAVKPPTETTARRSKRFAAQNMVEEYGEMNLSKDKAGRRVQGRNSKSPQKSSTKNLHALYAEQDPLAKYICHICNRGDVEEAMLLCDGCDDSYHTFCLMPPLNDIPKGDWRCPKCVVQEVKKPIEAFGFEQATREYTLQQFGEMADQFKADYFNMPVHLVPTELVEKEFWRITSSIDEDVTVEYGADLHTMDHGSGFPTKNSLYLLPDDQKYAESTWNLNNLPLLEESILGYINADISGMKIPWMYVGMCFATFCWHIEDHWSYSINYLHWGEPKTWYGVPGSSAETLEATMKRQAPELFENQPDLLHQLVTIMNPNILMAEGVPVYRCDQKAGEFVVTFPRAYHAGFNQGYNFAEAVNFAPADWMKLGRECVDHYSKMRRFCVFSHDELVCKMALESDRLNLGIATACYLDMVEMIDTEKKLRKSLLEWGVNKAMREAFELLHDDERQCDYCKTTCFLSAVTCECTKGIVCLRHYTQLCKCPPETHTLKYRYTLDELPLMLKKLKSKAESFEKWLKRVRDVLDPATPVKVNFDELQELAQEAETKKFPKSLLVERLNSAVLEAEKCITVIQQLDINKIRTRTRHSNDFAKYKLTLDELDLFVQEIDNLCCIIDDGISVKELQQMGYEFVANVKRVLNDECLTENNVDELSQLVQDGNSLCIELPQLELLKARLEQVYWYRNVRDYRDKQEVQQLVTLKKFLLEGMKIPPHYIVEREMSVIQQIIQNSESWEENVRKILESNTPIKLEDIENLLERGKSIHCFLPSFSQLKEALTRAKECLEHLETLQANDSYPYLETLEYVINRSRALPFLLEPIQRYEEYAIEARLWKDRACQTFLKKNSKFTLLEALTPKYDSDLTFAAYPPTPSPVNNPGDFSGSNSNLTSAPASSPISSSTSTSSTISAISSSSNGSSDNSYMEDLGPAVVVATFKKAEENEVIRITEIRRKNSQKHPERDAYCLCKGRFSGMMYHCQLCLDWFHSSCVPVPKHYNSKKSSDTEDAAVANVAQCDKYLCPLCQRTKRPKLETILALLVALQKIPLRVPEGEALQCVTERAMGWQDRVKQAVARNDIALALAKLSVQHQKKFETGDQQPQQSQTSTQPQQKADRKVKKPHMKKFKKLLAAAQANLSPGTSGDADKDGEEKSLTSNLSTLTPSSSETSSDPENMSDICDENEDVEQIPKSTPEHAYSIMCKQLNPNSNTTVPLIQLNRQTQEFLEELMMEGDLLEVTLDETAMLWQVLNASRERVNELDVIYKKYNIPNESPYKMFNEDNYKKRKFFEAGYTMPTKKQNKIKEENDGKVKKENEDGDDHDSEMENDNLPPSGASGVTKKSRTFLNKMGKGKLKMMKPKRGRKYKILKDKNQDPVQAKYKRKKISGMPTSPSSTIVSSNGIPVVSSTTSMPVPTALPGAKRTKGKERNGKTKTKKNKLHSSEIITSDEDEICSMSTNCARPSGSEVDWVQCDGGCNKWFHMFCVGLDKTQIMPDEDFICNSCKKLQQSMSDDKDKMVVDQEIDDKMEIGESTIGKGEEMADSNPATTSSATNAKKTKNKSISSNSKENSI